ncbi:alpha/beta fold hydrolase [Actinokineospora spheciospongiae]|uniref:alpha/beta fold hydrolase n=1 Tax=Actinokineospora spheciospongiae TaxID=909613 RepID=UPI001F2FCD1A|nr:alpha/beta hydrolase [Actinokineospora spheciospongiae]
MIESRAVRVGSGRVVRAHDSGPAGGSGPVVMWHHGSPQTGALLEPVLAAAAERGIRVLSYGRPGYGGSDRVAGRDVASAAGDSAAVADAFGVREFAVVGASGGGPHALACAALLPDRVPGAVCLAGIAPRDAGFDWFAGMVAPGGLRAAVEGTAARARFAETEQFDPESFIPADHELLAGPWSALGADAQRAGAAGPDGLVDDDVAFAHPWGFDLTAITAPVLLVQGGRDRVVPPAHADHLAGLLPRATAWSQPDDGHVSVLREYPAALDWLLAATSG